MLLVVFGVVFISCFCKLLIVLEVFRLRSPPLLLLGVFWGVFFLYLPLFVPSGRYSTYDCSIICDVVIFVTSGGLLAVVALRGLSSMGFNRWP